MAASAASLREDTANPAERAQPNRIKTVAAAVIGNAFEFYDFMVYATFAAMLGKVFFPSHNPNTSLLLSVATFGVGFVARPLGGIVIGSFADRFGRKPAMTLTIWLMALGSGMIGLLPTYEQIGVLAPLLLVVARLIQGFSAGGEMGPATTFLVESAPPDRVGFFGSWQLASQNIGILCASLIGLALAWILPPDAVNDWGWRVPFLLGILIAPVGLYIRRQLSETLETERAHASMGLVLSDLFRNHWHVIVLAILAISGGTIAQYFFGYATTYALTTLGFSTTVSMAVGVAVGISGMVFSIVGGVLADRFSLKSVSIVARVLMTVLFYPLLTLVLGTNSPTLFILAMCVLMAFQAMSGAAAIVLLPLCLPREIRTAGLSIGYATGVTIFGGTAQIVFTWLIETTGNKLAPLWYVVAAGIVSILATAAFKLHVEPNSASEVSER